MLHWGICNVTDAVVLVTTMFLIDGTSVASTNSGNDIFQLQFIIIGI